MAFFIPKEDKETQTERFITFRNSNDNEEERSEDVTCPTPPPIETAIVDIIQHIQQLIPVDHLRDMDFDEFEFFYDLTISHRDNNTDAKRKIFTVLKK